jgi:dTMP kinase
MAPGLFITFEGGEGAGKSTQVTRVAKRLKAAQRPVVVTREPGGSPGAEAIRALLVAGETDRWSALSEALLMNAARRDHIERVIGPALVAGAVVLCDRFSDSTRAYQGVAGGVDAKTIQTLEHVVVGEVRPNLTLIIDLPVVAGLARARSRHSGDSRFEDKGEAFHRRLRDAFLQIAKREPDRCVVINGAASPEDVEAQIWPHVAARL